MTGEPQGPMAAMYRVCSPLLEVAAALPSVRALPEAERLRTRLEQALQQLKARAQEASLPAADIDDACYALMALLDEQLLAASWEGRREWRREPLLQRHHGENSGGEGFWSRLERIAQQPQRAHVLRIYQACLSLGFEGKEAEASAERRDKLLRALEPALGPSSPLSPQGLADSERGAASRRELPAVLLAVGLVLAALAVLLVVKVSVWSSSAAAADAIRAPAAADSAAVQRR